MAVEELEAAIAALLGAPEAPLASRPKYARSWSATMLLRAWIGESPQREGEFFGALAAVVAQRLAVNWKNQTDPWEFFARASWGAVMKAVPADWCHAALVVADAEAERAGAHTEHVEDVNGYAQRSVRHAGGSIVYAPTIPEMEAALGALAPEDHPVAHLGNWAVYRCTCGSPRPGGLRCPACGSTFDDYERAKRRAREAAGEG